MAPEFTRRINWVLDNLVPPILRDPIVKIAIRLFFKSDADKYLSLHQRSYLMTEEDFKDLYTSLKHDILNRKTDLNQASIDLILKNIDGRNILDVGCGKQYLINYLVDSIGKDKINVTGVDFNIVETSDVNSNPNIVQGDIYNLPFDDDSFDTVICAHTLEHVLALDKAIAELRRVAAKRLIIVVPCEREYKYTFSFHVHFFPYTFSLLKLMKNPNGFCQKVDTDLFYIEDLS
ncbi:class I SAM-dependent methyltransferase [Wohlfahrtiimonas larvae]|uniref:Class I SAM-dependent methyltransferase n=1 Tax=Wohlfahrtiimonas larvae TaxID=1157986 RepID=A0ABP9MZ10_9GAMM|nr:class I SAM-dependent methyltransferase [Wohlfahrtiimonas larvae]